METLEAICTRRSVRSYTAQPVSQEMIERLLSAAMQAPSACNQQPWHFVVVNERGQLDTLADALPFGKMLKHGPLAIVVCADLELEVCRGYWVQDCSAATQNLLLAAYGMGLGAVWLGVYPVSERVAALQAVLGLPERVVPLCTVAIGYPAEQPEPVNRYRVERMHMQQW